MREPCTALYHPSLLVKSPLPFTPMKLRERYHEEQEGNIYEQNTSSEQNFARNPGFSSPDTRHLFQLPSACLANACRLSTHTWRSGAKCRSTANKSFCRTCCGRATRSGCNQQCAHFYLRRNVPVDRYQCHQRIRKCCKKRPGCSRYARRTSLWGKHTYQHYAGVKQRWRKD